MTAVAASVIASVSPAGATDGTDHRCIDPAAGGLQALAPTANAFLDQKSIDDQGRTVTLETAAANDAFTDRLMRILPNGDRDLGFGTDGFAVLPGVSRSFRMRNVVIDPGGRIWTMRATFADEFEIQRFNPNGTIDTTFERYLYLENGLVDPIGDLEIAEDGESLLIAYGRTVGENGGTIVQMTIRPDSIYVGRVQSGFLPGVVPRVLDISPDGWVAGELITQETEPKRFGFGWHFWPGFGENVPFRTEAEGVLTSIETLADDRVIGVGYTSVGGSSDGLVVRFDPVSDRVGDTQALGFGERVVDFGEAIDGIAKILPDGTALLYSGPDVFDAAIGLGSITSDGDVIVESFAQVGVGAVFPLEARVTADGRIDLAGWLDEGQAWRATFTAPLVLPQSGALDAQILRLYAAYFGRSADENGLAFWRDRRSSGASVGAVSDAFATSPEFIDTYGNLGDRQFVEVVYFNVLGRAGEATGVEFWTGELVAGRSSRGQLMVQFSDSPENVERTDTVAPHGANVGSLFRLYSAYFDRPPDGPGACFWTALLNAGTSLAEVSDQFAISPEFQQTYGTLSDLQFVELVYQNVLGRLGEPAGVAFWEQALTSGTHTRGQVLLGFSESPEYVETTNTLPRN